MKLKFLRVLSQPMLCFPKYQLQEITKTKRINYSSTNSQNGPIKTYATYNRQRSNFLNIKIGKNKTKRQFENGQRT